MQRTLHAGKFDQVQSDADDCHMRPLGQQVAVSGGRSQVDAVPPDGYTWKKWRDSVSESCCAATAPGVPSVLF